MSFTASKNKSHIVQAGIGSWWIKSITDGDAGYYNLGRLYDGKLSVKSGAQKDSKGRTKDFGAFIEASAKSYCTSKTSILQEINRLSHIVLSQAIETLESGWVLSNGLDDDYFGFKWRFVCDADSDKNRYIEYSANRKVVKSEVSDIYATTGVDGIDQHSNDELAIFSAINDESGVVQSGIKKCEVSAVYNTSLQNLGEITNGKLIVELLTQDDSLGAGRGYAVKIDCDVEALQASNSELEQLEALSGQAVYVKLTLMDDTIVWLGASGDQQIGLTWEFVSDTDSTGAAKIKYVGTGIVPITSLAAMFA